VVQLLSIQPLTASDFDDGVATFRRFGESAADQPEADRRVARNKNEAAVAQRGGNAAGEREIVRLGRYVVEARLGCSERIWGGG
jgi:hypothetical protein